MPVSGYLCLPKDAAEKSLPAHLFLHGYGVYSAGKRVSDSEITLEINAHGIDNGRDQTYYDTLRDTALKGYGLSVESNSDPELCYWNGVALRVIRALEYLKSLPQWDGENLIVSGGSQGGFQSLLAGGLDGDVTEIKAVVPWMCDISGAELSNRIDSFSIPAWTDALGYFDSANHAKRIKANVDIYAGLGDYVCPPSGQMVLFNSLNTPVKLTFSQGRTHGYEMPDSGKYTLEK